MNKHIFKAHYVMAALLSAGMLYSSFATAQTNGFRSLSGEQARLFQIPSNHVVMKRLALTNGRSALRSQQMIGNAQVFGGQLTQIKDATGNIQAVIGSHYPKLIPSNQILLSIQDAKQKAQQSLAKTIGDWKVQLMIDPTNGKHFYAVENTTDSFRWFTWVDAENGNVIKSYNGLTHATGIGVDGSTKDLTGITTFNGLNFELSSSDGRQTTNDAQNRRGLPGILATDPDDTWDLPGANSPGQAALVDAHFFARITDNYYLNTHSFDWVDYYPQGMVSSAHLRSDYNNAYWNGSQMAYGDGDGISFLELSGDLDVVGHELTHGVTEATSNLVYLDESGALNESFSDIMGANIEFYNNTGNWTLAEDISIGSNGFRNMANPNEDGDPSHYAERYTGTSDNGGVHTNSGIPNHWYYLLVNGGQNANGLYASGSNVQGIGITKAEDIAFLGFTSLHSSATFCDARASTIAAANVIDASTVSSVSSAWDEVGVDTTLCGGGSGGGGGGTSTAPVITDVTATNGRGATFAIEWATDIAATTEISLSCCGDFSDNALVTNHYFSFRGQNSINYEYYVTSTDAEGDSTTEGPFYHQN